MNQMYDQKCERCHGRGTVEYDKGDKPIPIQDCPSCDGIGLWLTDDGNEVAEVVMAMIRRYDREQVKKINESVDVVTKMIESYPVSK